MDSTFHRMTAVLDLFMLDMRWRRRCRVVARIAAAALALSATLAGVASAATPCDTATNPGQCTWLDSSSLPPFVHDAILSKGGVFGSGNVLVLSSGDPLDPDSEISNDVNLAGCGTNPDGWETYDCTLMVSFVPLQDSVVLALSSEWFEWYQTIFTDWMTISGAGVATVDVSINSWISSKVDVIPYGPWETGVVLLTSVSAQKMVDFRVSDSGDHIYDTAIVVVPASWFSGIDKSGNDPTLLCGDDKLEPGEECDDGNLVADDGCSNLCLGSQPPPPAPPPPSITCGNLKYTWPNGTTAPYTCGGDLCAGFRCVIGDTISPACYMADQCAAACGGSCVDVQVAQPDCATMCSVQPPANQPPVVVAPTCENLAYVWSDGSSMPYSCDDSCHGQRCITGGVVSSECFKNSDCDDTTCPGGACVDTPPADCAAFCLAAQLPSICSEAENGNTRLAANQNGPCQGNIEICKTNGLWKPTDGAFAPDDEVCNGIDDDCNGVMDDVYVTCGDFGLCQNTVNTCDPANPTVPVVCTPLPAPSPIEICNNGLDDDCEGSVDDGCECGDKECMPGENWVNCPADCPKLANGTSCDDTNFCTSGETWQNGVCTGGAAVTCDSANACLQAGACVPSSGCSATKVSCDDGVLCTEDTCDASTGCLNAPADSACADGDPCTLDICDVVTGCGHTADPLCSGQDIDGDGYVSTTDGGDDCDDSDAHVNPGAVEVCNAIDDNCDTNVDEGYGAGESCSGAASICGTAVPGMYICLTDTTGVECNAPAAMNPTGYGDACESSANSCGSTNTGTIGCEGPCDASVPVDPATLGNACESSTNSCGSTNAGTIGCDGLCDASVPVAVDGDNDGTPDCQDICYADPAKTAPGDCGCGAADADVNSNDISDCLETAGADLGITAALNTRKPAGGKHLRVRWEVTNAGPDSVQPGVTIAGSISGGEVGELRLPKGCSGAAEAFACDIADLQAGRRRAMKVQVVPMSGSTLRFTLTVSGPLLDPNPANQSATVEVVVP